MFQKSNKSDMWLYRENIPGRRSNIKLKKKNKGFSTCAQHRSVVSLFGSIMQGIVGIRLEIESDLWKLSMAHKWKFNSAGHDHQCSYTEFWLCFDHSRCSSSNANHVIIYYDISFTLAELVRWAKEMVHQ